MVRDPSASKGQEPTLESVATALDDPDCRTIVRRLDEPMTAGELAERCDSPTSTIYRKLDRLSSASRWPKGPNSAPTATTPPATRWTSRS